MQQFPKSYLDFRFTEVAVSLKDLGSYNASQDHGAVRLHSWATSLKGGMAQFWLPMMDHDLTWEQLL